MDTLLSIIGSAVLAALLAAAYTAGLCAGKLPRMWMMKNQKFICRTHMAEILTPERRDSHISD